MKEKSLRTLSKMDPKEVQLLNLYTIIAQNCDSVTGALIKTPMVFFIFWTIDKNKHLVKILVDCFNLQNMKMHPPSGNNIPINQC